MSLSSLYPNPHMQNCPWYDAAASYGAPNLKWCEETLCQWISEPANTWSNGLYLMIALYLFSKWRNHAFSPLKYSPLAIGLMGLFSLIYHLSNFYLTQLLDFIGMFICIYNLLLMNIHRIKKLSMKNYLLIYSLLSILSLIGIHIGYLHHIPIQFSIMLIVLSIFITEFYLYFKKQGPKNYLNFYLSLVFLSIAVMFSTLDIKRIWCDPSNHWAQGHAFWHLSSAVMMYFIHKHYAQLWNEKKMGQLKS